MRLFFYFNFFVIILVISLALYFVVTYFTRERKINKYCSIYWPVKYAYEGMFDARKLYYEARSIENKDAREALRKKAEALYCASIKILDDEYYREAAKELPEELRNEVYEMLDTRYNLI